jgi:hypothetical protein
MRARGEWCRPAGAWWRLAEDGIRQLGALRGRGVRDDRERGLQGVGEVAPRAPRLLGLSFIVLEQRVQFLRQRLDLLGEALLDPRLSRPSGWRRSRAAPA